MEITNFPNAMGSNVCMTCPITVCIHKEKEATKKVNEWRLCVVHCVYMSCVRSVDKNRMTFWLFKSIFTDICKCFFGGYSYFIYIPKNRPCVFACVCSCGQYSKWKKMPLSKRTIHQLEFNCELVCVSEYMH